jgi:acyl-CoA hydrolase
MQAWVQYARAHRGNVEDVELVHLHTMGEASWADPELRGSFRVANLFVGANLRKKFHPPEVDYIPCFLSEIPNLFRSRRRPLHGAILHLSPPDRHGFCSLGTSVDVARAAFDSADWVYAQINPRMPRVHGDGFIHLSELDGYVEVEEPLLELEPPSLGPEELKIGEYVASLVEDGSTLQMGIGSIPDAVLKSLGGHRSLGIHTEMWSDGALELLERGVVNNSKKVIHPGKTVSGFVMGTEKIFRFIHDNPSVVQLDISYVNQPEIIARNPKVVAINSAVEIDLTGQVCADSVGSRILSGVGGQMDFIRGASLSPGGKPILAIRSRTASGHSRLVPTLREGAGVVTTRSHVHFVVTEYGVADLYGRTLQERAQALIALAHPEDREGLDRSWRKLFQS